MYRIVLADDEWLELDTLAKYIPWREMGFEVVGTAKNGREALSLVKELLPDILITDVKMPLMDGVELARLARELMPRLKIVFQSGYDDFKYVKSALQVEACGYLLKPLNRNELHSLMAKVKAKCVEEMRSKQSSLALLAQYMKHALSDYSQQREKAAEIARLGMELMPSYTSKYSCMLLTIDEYPLLSKYQMNGPAIIEEINRELEQLAAEESMLAISLNEHTYFIIGIKDPLDLLLQWPTKMKAQSRWVTLCLYPQQTALEDAAEVYRELQLHRNRHVYLYGPGHVIVADTLPALQARPGIVEPPVPESLYSFINQGKLQEAEQWVDDYIAYQSIQSDWSPEFIIQGCMGLIDELYLTHILPHANIRQQMEDKAKMFNRLSAIESVPQIAMTIRQFTTMLGDALSRLQTGKHTVLIAQVKALIEREYARPLTIEYLSEQVYLSPNYLRAIFKDHTGLTVLEYITQVRMEHAAGMLRSSAYRVHEISGRVGYESASHFCTIFLKKMGLTPNQYRNQQLGR